MKYSEAQIMAIDALNDALKDCTALGILDKLLDRCDDPNSINDVCDAVTDMQAEANA